MGTYYLHGSSPSTSFTDSCRLPLSINEIGTTEIFATSLLLSLNGRFVSVVGDGEYNINTSPTWRNKSFGNRISSACQCIFAADACGKGRLSTSLPTTEALVVMNRIGVWPLQTTSPQIPSCLLEGKLSTNWRRLCRSREIPSGTGSMETEGKTGLLICRSMIGVVQDPRHTVPCNTFFFNSFAMPIVVLRSKQAVLNLLCSFFDTNMCSCLSQRLPAFSRTRGNWNR